MAKIKGQTMMHKTLHKKTKYRQTRTPLKTRIELRCTGRVILDKNPVISHE